MDQSASDRRHVDVIVRETYVVKKVEEIRPAVLFVSVDRTIRFRAKESRPAVTLISYAVRAMSYKFSAQNLMFRLLEPARFL